MKGSQQKLVLEKPPVASTIGSPQTPGSANKIQRVCQSQVEQLAAQLPIVAVWLVYDDPERGKRQLIVHYAQAQSFNLAMQSYLESEVWLEEFLPVLKVGELAIAPSINAYVCLLSQSLSHPEYVLLWAYEALSELQQQCALKQTQLLIDCLTIYKECCCKQAEIQLLEQVVRRAEHQLRNPLALISLYAENLRLSLPIGFLQEQATVIRETAIALSSSLRDLLSCSQQEKLQLAPHDLRMILIESVKGLKPWIEEKNLQIRYPDSSLVVAVDRWQIKQVFDNLLSNAVHFSPPGETVTCHWQIFRNEAIFEISDRGKGLSEEDLKQAFTPFYSRRPGGTGLGLAIAKKIILDRQGSIWVENLPEGGAQFSFTLPIIHKVDS